MALDATNTHLYADTLFEIPIFDANSGSQTGSIPLGPSGQWFNDLAGSADQHTILVDGLDSSSQWDGQVFDSATASRKRQFFLNATLLNVGVNGTGTEGFFFYTRGGPERLRVG